MKKEKINTDKAPKAIGPYAQALRCDQTIYLSGQIPLNPDTMIMVNQDITAEMNQVFLNLQAVAHASGGKLSDIVKLTIYLTDLIHFPMVNDIMTQFFQEPYPARTTIQVSALPKGARVEIDAIMVLS